MLPCRLTALRPLSSIPGGLPHNTPLLHETARRVGTQRVETMRSTAGLSLDALTERIEVSTVEPSRSAAHEEQGSTRTGHGQRRKHLGSQPSVNQRVGPADGDAATGSHHIRTRKQGFPWPFCQEIQLVLGNAYYVSL